MSYCTCTDESAGICEARGCFLPAIHKRLCREGNGEAVDRLLEQKQNPANQAAGSGKGTGSIVARKLKVVGLGEAKGCGCKELAARMDRNGPDWCETNREMIVEKIVKHRGQLAEWLGFDRAKTFIEASVFLPFFRTGAGHLLDSSIKEARESIPVIETPVQKTQRRRRRQRPKSERRHRTRTVTLKNSPKLPPAPEPRPFGEVKTNVLFHLYPTFIEQVEYHAQQANKVDASRKILAIASSPATIPVEQVMEHFGDDWEVVEFQNDPRLREVLTYRRLLEMVESTDENEVTLCLHGKGAQPHTEKDESVRWWTDAMYATVAHNMPEVIARLSEGHAIAGSFRRFGRHLGCRHQWHFSGTFYAFRNALMFNNGIPKIRDYWWGTESWPGDHIPASHAACLFADNMGDPYKVNQQPRTELEIWKESRAAIKS